MVALVGFFALSDAITSHEYLGIAVLGCGIFLMARGVFAQAEDRKLLPFALGSACATAAYTLIDGLGARVSGDAAAYVAWVFVADGLIFTTVTLLWKGTDVLPRDLKSWGMAGFASAASYGSYAIAIWAMTFAPLAVVAALRETSILFGVLIAWLFLKEKVGKARVIGAGLITAGAAVPPTSCQLAPPSKLADSAARRQPGLSPAAAT